MDNKEEVEQGQAVDKYTPEMIDQEISESLQSFDASILESLIDAPKELVDKVDSCLESYGQIPKNLLQEILMQRDRSIFDYKQSTITQLKGEDIKLYPEFKVLYAQIQDAKEVTEIQAKDKDGKDIVLYYFEDDNNITRVKIGFNEAGDLEDTQSHFMTVNGNLFNYNNGKMVYEYNDDSQKVAGICQNDINGNTYYEYDEDGKIKLSKFISEEINVGRDTIELYLNPLKWRNEELTALETRSEQVAETEALLEEQQNKKEGVQAGNE